VKIRFFGKEAALIVCFVFLFSALTFAADKDVARIHGKVMELNVSKTMLVVNEKTFVWDANSVFYDEKGSPITVDKLQLKSWVYIEGLWGKKNKPITIKKIYLLPKYIGPKERGQYPFMH
jgi:hypothetical protein